MYIIKNNNDFSEFKNKYNSLLKSKEELGNLEIKLSWVRLRSISNRISRMTSATRWLLERGFHARPNLTTFTITPNSYEYRKMIKEIIIHRVVDCRDFKKWKKNMEPECGKLWNFTLSDLREYVYHKFETVNIPLKTLLLFLSGDKESLNKVQKNISKVFNFDNWWDQLSHTNKLQILSNSMNAQAPIPNNFRFLGKGVMTHIKNHKRLLVPNQGSVSVVTVCKSLVETPKLLEETKKFFQTMANERSKQIVVTTPGESFENAILWVVPNDQNSSIKRMIRLFKGKEMAGVRALLKTEPRCQSRRNFGKAWTSESGAVRTIQNTSMKMGIPNIIYTNGLATRRPGEKVTKPNNVARFVKLAADLRSCIVEQSQKQNPTIDLWRGGTVDGGVAQVMCKTRGLFQTANPLSFSADEKVAKRFMEGITTNSDKHIRYLLHITTSVYCNIEPLSGYVNERERIVPPGMFRITCSKLNPGIRNTPEYYNITATFTPDTTYMSKEKRFNPLQNQSVFGGCPIMHNCQFPPRAKRRRFTNSYCVRGEIPKRPKR
jgi:hypothetical protein